MEHNILTQKWVDPYTLPRKTLYEVEREYILRVLKENNWNRTHTAKDLGIALRTVRTKIAEYKQQGFKVSET